MYERSAIVLENYYNNFLGLNERNNLRQIYNDYVSVIEEVKKYQTILEKEEDIISKFDNSANSIRAIQQEKNKIYQTNYKLEDERNQLFNNLEDEPEVIEKKFKAIEEKIQKNNTRTIELREAFIKILSEFTVNQKERNKISRSRRAEEKFYIEVIGTTKKNVESVDLNLVRKLKAFVNIQDEEKTPEEKEIYKTMINNGKGERIQFNKSVIENAIKARDVIAKRESTCYIIALEKERRVLQEATEDDVEIEKYDKILKELKTKLAFLAAEKNYITSFLDYERMTTISGQKAHDKLMQEACRSFELDLKQFDNLYELIEKEATGKATKKSYNELYNKEYIKKIEEKERSFEEEISNIDFQSGAMINSNYWRITEIKNIYGVFQKEVTEQFGKDLSDFQLEEVDEEELPEIIETKPEVSGDEIFKKVADEDDVEYIDEYEFDEDDEYDIFDEDEDLSKLQEKEIEEEKKNNFESKNLKSDEDEEYLDIKEYNDFDEDTFEEEIRKENQKNNQGLFNKFF